MNDQMALGCKLKDAKLGVTLVQELKRKTHSMLNRIEPFLLAVGSISYSRSFFFTLKIRLLK